MRPTRHPHQLATRTGIARVAVGVCALVVSGQLAGLPTASAAPSAAADVAPIDLGTAETYSVLAGTGVANTGTGTVLSGDLGLSPSGAIAGFPPGTLAGTVHDKDPAAARAQTDRQAAYEEAASLTSTATFAGDLAGVTLKPGVHTSAAAVTNTGTLTLDADGDQSAVFVLQIGAAYSAAAASKVVLVDGALANNVFWQVVGATSLGAGAQSVGTYLGAGAITLGDGASMKGRALTPGTVTLTNAPLTEPKDDFIAPVVTIDGGDTRSTSDTTPAISGTTDEPGNTVTVKIAGQTLTTPAGDDGAWTVSTGALTEGIYTVVASVTDGSQNVGTAIQFLTVDVTAPVVNIGGGATDATNDRTPTITGRTDAPTDTPVAVSVAGQTLHTTVAEAGTWSVTAATLSEAAHQVVATVDDAAGNSGTATQLLTVDVTLPVVTIDGGATDSTTDTSPWIEGTTAEKAGTIVHLTVGGQNLNATVLSDGTWSVSATTLSSGPHDVVASITDEADNTGTARQTLTVGPVAPSDTFRPDAAIRAANGSYVGVGTYGATNQRVGRQLRGAVRTARFDVRVTNRGDASDRLELVGTARNPGFKVTYLAGGQNVTDAVTAGRYTTGALAPGASTGIVIKVTRTKAARPNDRRVFSVQAVSTRAPAMTDTVAAVVKVVA